MSASTQGSQHAHEHFAPQKTKNKLLRAIVPVLVMEGIERRAMAGALLAPTPAGLSGPIIGEAPHISMPLAEAAVGRAPEKLLHDLARDDEQWDYFRSLSGTPTSGNGQIFDPTRLAADQPEPEAPDLFQAQTMNDSGGFALSSSNATPDLAQPDVPAADPVEVSEATADAEVAAMEQQFQPMSFSASESAYQPAGGEGGNEVSLLSSNDPYAPSDLTATAVSTSQINLSWTNNHPDAEEFIVEYSTDGTNFQYHGWTYWDTTYAATGLAQNTTYYFRVAAYSWWDYEPTDYSNIASATTHALTLPAAPSNLTATAVSGTQINLSWSDHSTNEDGFRIERSTDGANYAEIATVGANTTGYQSTGLNQGTTYHYRIRAYNAAGNSDYSNSPSATTMEGMAAPTNVQATAISTTRIDLAWTNNAADADEVFIELSTDGTNFAWWDSAYWGQTSYSFTGLTPNTTYYFRLMAYSWWTGESSSYSQVASATTQPLANTGDGTGLSATYYDNSDFTNPVLTRTDATVNFDWGGASPAPEIGSDTFSVVWTGQVLAQYSEAYTFYTQTDDGVRLWVNGQQLINDWNDHAPSENQGTIALVAGQKYDLRMEFYENWGGAVARLLWSSPSTPKQVIPQTQLFPTTSGNVPAAPSDLTAEGISTTQILLQWIDNSNDEFGFKIERSSDGVHFDQIAVVAAGTNTFTDSSGLASGTSYYYRVRAYGGGGDSTYSNTAEGTTAVPPSAPAAPSGLVANAMSSSRIDLAWVDNSGNEVGFKIERSTNGTTWVQIASMGVDQTSYSDTGLSPSTQYHYRVRAYNGQGHSAYSAAASAATPAALPPAAPSDLTAAPISSSRIELTWTDNSGDEVGFKIERSTAGQAYVEIDAVAPNSTSYMATGLAAGVAYTFRIRAYNLDGSSGYSNATTAITTSVLHAPRGLTATAVSASRIDLTWIDVADEVGYRIERSLDANSWEILDTASANVTSYSDTGLAEGTNYYYRLRAYDAAGETGHSGSVSAVTLPAAPTNLSAQEIAAKTVQLSWTDNSSGEAGFRIDRSLDGVTWSPAAVVGPDTVTWTEQGVQEGTTHFYRVCAFNAGGTSTYAEMSSATTPAAPSGLIAEWRTNGVELVWMDNSVGESAYEIERSSDAQTWTQLAAAAASAVSHLDETAAAGVRYFYRIRATSASGNSAYSNVADSSAERLYPRCDLAPGGWQKSIRNGSGRAGHDAAGLTLFEGSSFITSVEQILQIPAQPSILALSYSDLLFDESDGDSIKDAFELALVDSAGNSLVHTFAGDRDAFFNITEGLSPALGATGYTANGIVRLDLSEVPAGEARLIVRLINNDQDQETAVTLLCEEAPTPLMATISGAPSVDEGSPYTLSLMGLGDGAQNISQWTINWGDGSLQTVTGNAAAVNHTYADGDVNYTITATATSGSVTAQSNALTVQVQNVAPTLLISGPGSALAGETYTLNLASDDPGADTITHWTIDWGDGTVQVVQGDPFSATHVFATGGATYTIHATATDEDGTFAANSLAVAVSTPTDVRISGAGSTNEGSPYQLDLSTIGAIDVQSWTIDWGDGTSETVAGTEAVADHVYGDDGTNTGGEFLRTITAVAATENGSVASNAVAVVVRNIAPQLVAGYGFRPTGAAGQKQLAISMVGRFTDPAFAPSETFTVTIDWGDGQTQQVPAAVVYGSAGTASYGTFSADHVYSNGAIYTARVTVQDDDGGSDFEEFSFGVVGIDVHEPINLKSGGKTNVDIFPGSSNNFAATRINASSLRFGPASAPEVDNYIGSNGRAQFYTYRSGIQPDDDVAFLSGTLTDGTPFVGMDRIRIANGSDKGKPGVESSPTKFFVADAAVRIHDNTDYHTIFGYGPGGSPTFNAVYLTTKDGNTIISYPTGIASNLDSSRLWTIDRGTGKVDVHKPDGAVIGAWKASGVVNAQGITTNQTSTNPGGGDIWLVDAALRQVLWYGDSGSMTAGQMPGLPLFNLHPDNSNPTDLVTDGMHFWVSQDHSATAGQPDPLDEVFVYDTSGKLLGRWRLDPNDRAVSGITLDPTGASNDIWTVDRGSRKVYAYSSARILRGDAGALAATSSFELTNGNTIPEGLADPMASAVELPDSRGTDFWLAFQTNHTQPSELKLFITSDVDTTGVVSVPGLNFSQNFSVAAGTVETVILPSAAMLTGSDVVEDKAVHVTANREVSVYGLNYQPATTDAFLGLPTDVLGTEYLTLGYRNGTTDYYFFTYQSDGTQFAVVATEDDTTVTVTPSSTVGARQAGVPYTILLDRGEAYQLTNPSAPPADLSGSVILSDKPVAVFGGHRLVNIPEGYAAADHIVEQMFPAKSWGKTFITVPLALRSYGDTFRVLAAEDATEVRINGAVVAELNRGQWHEQIIDDPAQIVASKPVLVAQYSNSQRYDNATHPDDFMWEIGDPFMMLVPPHEQFLPSYTVTTPATGFALNYLNIIVPDAVVGAIELDGTAIPATEFQSVGTSGFSITQKAVGLGSHSLSGPEAFGVLVYGYDWFDSYGYPGGLSLAPVAEAASLTIAPKTFARPVQTEHTVEATVLDDQGRPLRGLRVEFTVEGVNGYRASVFTDATGVARYTYTGNSEGTDAIVARIGSLMDVAHVQWTVFAPNIVVTSPAPGAEVPQETHQLVTGRASAGDRIAPIVSVTVDGVAVEAFDSAGNFFTRVRVGPGYNTFTFVATDAYGQTASTALTLKGVTGPTQRGSDNVSGSVTGEYRRTSFNDRISILYAEMALRNIGQYLIDAPLYVGIANISDPSVRVQNPDGTTAEGVPFYDYSYLASGATLAPGEKTGFRHIEFLNTKRVPFTYDLVLLGQMNRAPVFSTVPIVEAVAERQFVYDADAVDPDDTVLTYSLMSKPEGMTVDPKSGLVSWKPSLTDIGSRVSVELVVEDGRGGSAVQRFVIAVADPSYNRPPKFTSVPVLEAYVNTGYSYQVRAEDPDGDPLTYELDGPAAGMTIHPKDGLLTWTPVAAQSGSQSITIKASDGRGGVAQQSFVVRVGPERGSHNPVIVSQPPLVAPVGREYSYQLDVHDADGDELTYSLSEPPTGMAVTSSGRITWTPTIDQLGMKEVTVRVLDARGGTATQSFKLLVTELHTAELHGAVFNDLDGDGLQHPPGGDPGTEETGLSNWTVYLDLNQNGRINVGEPFTTTDSSGAYAFTELAAGSYRVSVLPQPRWLKTVPSTGTRSVSVTDSPVTAVNFGFVQSQTTENNNPSFDTLAPTTATAGRLYRYNARATDPDGDSLTFSLTTKPQGMTVDPGTGLVVWTPSRSQVGNHHVVLRVEDGNGGAAIEPFSISVTAANNAPVIISVPVAFASIGLPYQYQVVAQDADGDQLDYALTGHPAMSLDASGLFTWTPSPSDEGLHSVIISVTDGKGGEAYQEFELRVAEPAANRAPRIVSSPRATIQVGQLYNYEVRARDDDADPISYELMVQPDGMSITAGGQIEWTPASEQYGSNNVTVRVTDGRGGEDIQSFTIEVVSQAANKPPEITSVPPFQAVVGEQYRYEARAHDPDNDAVTWTVVGPGGVSVGRTTGILLWTPEADQVDVHQIELTATDPFGASFTQMFSVQVRAVNSAPQIQSKPPTNAAQGSLYTYAVRAYDPDNHPLEFALDTKPDGMSIDGAGLIKWTPATGITGSHDVSVVVTDLFGASDTQNYTILVSAAASNGRPVIESEPPYFAAVGEQYEYQILAVDPDDDPLQYQLLDDPPANMSVDATGLLSWIPAVNQSGSHYIRVAVYDPSGLGAIQGFYLNVRENRAPSITSPAVANAVAGAAYLYDVQVHDSDNDPIAFRLLQHPAGMTINQYGQIRWSPGSAETGSYPVAIEVSDPYGGKDVQVYDLVVGSDTTAPAVQIEQTAPQSPHAAPGTQVTLQVLATDNVGVQAITLAIEGRQLPLDSQGKATVTVGNIGDYVAEATATDAAGNIGRTTRIVQVRDTADTSAPHASLTAPFDAAEITAPTAVTGTVSDAEGLVNYQLEIAPNDGSENWTEIKRESFATPRTEPLTGELGSFDPTLLKNGTYRIRLTAEDTGGNTAIALRTVYVAGEMKPGNFRISETDLSIPLSGIPISLTRSYDSLNRHNYRDFGYGWTLGVDVDLQEGPEQRAWFPMDLHQGSGYKKNAVVSVRMAGSRDVWLTLPDGRRTQFSFEIQPTGADTARGIFNAELGVFAKLEILGDNTIKRNGAGPWYWQAGTAPGQEVLSNPPGDYLELYDIPGYVLTLEDGTKLTIQKTERPETVPYDMFFFDHDGQTNGIYSYVKKTYYQDAKVTNIEDTNGNRIDIFRDGIAHSNGTGIAFIRDGSGRVAKVTDATGQVVLEYGYDSHGDLVAVTRLVQEARDGQPAKKVTTKYNYTHRNGTSTHNLKSITSPSGKTPVINEYDERGRLIASVDAFGKRIEYGHLIGQRREVITDRLGQQTVFDYDDGGHVTQVVNPLGEKTVYTYYPNSSLVQTETIAAQDPGLAFTKSYEYDAKGYRTEETYAPSAGGTPLTTTWEYIDTAKGEHALLRMVNPAGVETLNSYDAVSSLLTETMVRDTQGSVLQKVTYGAYDRGNPTRVTRWNKDTGGQWVPYVTAVSAFDSAGRVVESRHEDAAGTTLTKSTFTYDANGNALTSTHWKKDSGGAWVAYATTSTEYDRLNRPVKSIDPLNNARETFYNSDGQVARTINARGIITENSYDALGQHIRSTYAVGTPEQRSTSTTYDANGRVLTSTNEYGNVTRYFYDAAGRPVQTLHADGTVDQTVYDGAGRVYVTEDRHVAGQSANGTRTIYDLAGRAVATERVGEVIINVTAAAGATSSSTLASTGRVLSTSSTAYDAVGRVQSTTSPDGQTTQYEYDTLGRQKKVIQPAVDVWNATTQQYERVNPTIEYNYDALGRQAKVIDPLGHETGFAYDELGRVTRTTYHDGSYTTARYDELGRKVAETEQVAAGAPAGPETNYEYNVAGNLTAVLQPAVDDPQDTLPNTPVRPRHEYGYNQYGEQTSQKDAKGRVTTYGYDAFGRRTSRTLPEVSGQSVSESWTYDNFGRLKTHTDFMGQSTRHVYSDSGLNAGRLLEEQRFSGAVDPTPDEKTVYTYDELGRRQDVSEYANGNMTTPVRATSYSYDVISGGVSQVSSPEGTINYTYDAATGQLTRTHTDHNDTNYDYDELGRLRHVTQTKLNGSTVNLVTTYRYDAAGNLDTVEQPNGVVSDYDYDALNRLNVLTVANAQGNKLFEQDYVLLPDGQRDHVIEKRYDGTSSTPLSKVKVNWTYDALDRLIEETRDSDPTPANGSDDFGTLEAGDYTDTYVLDLVGNRLGKSHDEAGIANDSAVAYIYNDRDQLTGEGPDSNADNVPDSITTTYSYDANGSTISVTSGSSTKKYAWDLRNRLVGLDANGDDDLNDPGDATFGYDHEGTRVSRIVNIDADSSGTVDRQEAVYFLQDKNNPTGYSQVLEESSTPADTPERSYVIGHDIIAQADGSTVRHLLYDGGGSTRGLLDATGQPVTDQIYAYDAFGNRIEDPANPITPLTNLLYRGEYFDVLLGQYQLRARYYTPTSGRFWSFDSYEGATTDPQSLHKYMYASNDPIRNVDPTGYFSLVEKLTVAGKAMGYTSGNAMLLHMGASGLVNVIVEYAFDDDGYSPLEGVTDFLIGAATAPVGIAAPAKLLKHVGKAFGKFIGSRLMLKALTQFGSSFLESLADTAAFALKRKYVEQQPVTYGLLAEYFIGNLVFTAAFSQVPLGFRFATVQGKDELNALSRKDKGAWKRWLDNYTGVSSAELRDKREMLQNYVIPMLDNVNGFFTWQIRGVEMGDFILDFFINMSGEAHEANLDID